MCYVTLNIYFHLLLFFQVLCEDEYEEWLQSRKSAEIDLENGDQLILESNSVIETQVQLLGT